MTMQPNQNLAQTLIDTWARQGQEGFLLSDPQSAHIETRTALDESCGVHFRFLWMPHREARGDVPELERRGILNPNRDESKLFRDSRDPSGRHCFLCEKNVRECHPMEHLVPLTLAGKDYYAGANFAWIEHDHFTVMAAEHTDQVYSQHGLQAMLELHQHTEGKFRILFNGNGAGATIPWHLHYQITTTPMPIESLTPGKEANYPTIVHRCPLNDNGFENAHTAADAWIKKDPENHTINVLISGTGDQATIWIFPRDQRRAKATNKGLVGGFEVAGDFVLSAPAEREPFETSDAQTARDILQQIRPQV